MACSVLFSIIFTEVANYYFLVASEIGIVGNHSGSEFVCVLGLAAALCLQEGRAVEARPHILSYRSEWRNMRTTLNFVHHKKISSAQHKYDCPVSSALHCTSPLFSRSC
jgi:hypothetical protein